MKIAIRTFAFALLLFSLTDDARADGWISPLVGVNFGGDAGGRFEDVAREREHLTWGFAAGGMSAGFFGGELDFAYSSHFFGTDEFLTDNNVLTIVPTLMLGIPIGGQRGVGIRPYGAFGIGWVRRKLSVGGIDVFDNENDAVWTLGGGLMLFFADHVGIRGDYRYLRTFSADGLEELLRLNIKQEAFRFSRASAGVVLRF